ncbi:MAG: PilZ domain-containing protein [Polyangiaceae bacterium]|jgi:uncharacterized protein (TIGR02266 family)
MAQDRRTARRARPAGLGAIYESATGERREADVLDLGAGGLFLRTDSPWPVGKRISLDLHVPGEASPWSALGRVIWIRTSAENPDRPAGMAVKLIDIEDAVAAAIGRLVAAEEPVETRPQTQTTTDPSLALNLVASKTTPSSPEGPVFPPEPPARLPKRRRGWLLLLGALLAAAIAAGVYRDELPALWQAVREASDRLH